MARLARVEVFSADEVAVVHVMNRVVRRCFLLGDDPVTGKNYDHRKVWIEDLLKRFAAAFGIDLLSFAILSNHFHLILRSRPDVVATWDDSEVARRWLMLCPVRKTAEHLPEDPNEPELDSIRNDPQKLAAVRSRLSDIGWWMRLLCQQVATRANREDHEVGKFWQARFRAVRLLDEQALLACSAYVDLNPIRAALAETLETSDYTSVQRRIQAAQNQKRLAGSKPAASVKQSEAKQSGAPSQPAPVTLTASLDGFLSPLTLEEPSGALGAVPSRSGLRCSDKGFLPISAGDYLILLDWTARQAVAGKRGANPKALQPIFERLSLDPTIWCALVGSFGRLFYNVAGLPPTIDATSSRVSQRQYHVPTLARKLLSTPPESTSA